MGSQVMAFTKNAFLNRHRVVIHLPRKQLTLTLNIPPQLPGFRSLTINGTLSGNSNILALVSIDKRTVIVQQGPFPTGSHHRQVVSRITTKKQSGTFLYMQGCVTDKMNGTVDKIL